MKIGVLYSGGKDSTYAAYLAKRQGHNLTCLITVVPENPESYLFHYPNACWTDLQAEAMKVPIVKMMTDGKSVKEIQDLVEVVKVAKETYHIEGVVTGGLASRYQKNRFEAVCVEAGLKVLSPLWLEDPEEHMRSIVESDFVVVIVGVAAEGLHEDWLGRLIDHNTIGELKDLNRRFGVHIAFEGGEAETFVLDCPLFSKRIDIVDAQRHWYGDRGFLEIKEARLVEKIGIQKS